MSLIHATVARAGAHMEMGIDLYRIFQQAGLPAPELQLEIPLSADPDFIQGISDILVTVLPQIAKTDATLARLGDLGTLPGRLRAEVAESKSVVPWMGLVGVWSRTLG
jgi:hypothetical protein